MPAVGEAAVMPLVVEHGVVELAVGEDVPVVQHRVVVGVVEAVVVLLQHRVCVLDQLDQVLRRQTL